METIVLVASKKMWSQGAVDRQTNRNKHCYFVGGSEKIYRFKAKQKK